MTRRILSCRASRLTMSRGLTFEFEDVVVDADLTAHMETAAVPTESVRRLAWRAHRAGRLVLDRSKPGPDGADELVFAMAQSPTDLADHMVFAPMIRAGGSSAAYIEEMWVKNVPLQPDVRRFLAEFDHVFVGCEGTVESLGEHLQTPVSYLPPSVDMDRFAADPWPATAIDVYAMGRRHPQLHDALQRWADADQHRFYLYDTFSGNVPIADHAQHRRKLADIIRRSRFFLANEAKVDEPNHTGHQSEVGYRFFEGAAAGAVMVGLSITAPAFERLFGWDEPVVTVDPSGDDIAERLKELDQDAGRRDAIRRRNAAGSLRTHDVAHRWRQVLDTLGLEVPAGVTERIDRLADRADHVDPGAADRVRR